jgi:hypothetical protein
LMNKGVAAFEGHQVRQGDNLAPAARGQQR